MVMRNTSDKRILLYDPSAALGANLASYLQREKLEVVHESELERAVQKARDQWYALVILRVDLPDAPDPGQQILTLLQRFPPQLRKTLYYAAPRYGDPNEIFALAQKFIEINTRAIAYSGDYERDRIFQRIQEHFTHRINPNLDIRSGGRIPTTLPALIGWLDPHLPGDLIVFRIEEMKDLFSQHFFSEHRVDLERTFWQRDGQAGILASLQTGDPAETHCLMVLRRENCFDGMQSFPELPGFLSRRAEPSRSSHYSLATFTLDGAPRPHLLEHLHDLRSADRTEALTQAIHDLFMLRVPAWKVHIHLPAHKEDLHQLYRTRLQLESPEVIMAQLEGKITALQQQLMDKGAGISMQEDSFNFEFPDTFSFPQPIRLLKSFLNMSLAARPDNNPGSLHLDSILVDRSTGRTWLTDCSGQGIAPPGWAAIQLETDLSFGIDPSLSLFERFQLEQSLCQAGLQVDVASLPDSLQSIAGVIAKIRTSSGAHANSTPFYQAGLVYQSISILLKSDTTIPLTAHEAGSAFAALAGLVLLMQVFSEQGWLSQKKPAVDIPAQGLIAFDQRTGKFSVDGKEFRLSGKPKQMLIYCLNQKSGDLLRYSELAISVIGKDEFQNTYSNQKYNLRDYVQQNKNRIEKAIHGASPGPGVYFQPVREEGYYFYNPPQPQ